MRPLLIALSGVFAAALCGQALADDLNPQPLPPGRKVEARIHAFNPQPDPPRHSGQDCGVAAGRGPESTERKAGGEQLNIGSATGGAGSGRRTETTERKAGGEQLNVGSATGGAGSGRVHACASGEH